MIAALLDGMAESGRRLTDAARSLGGTVAFDPRQILHRDTVPPLEAPSHISANRHCRLIEARDGWLAVNLAREEDRLTVPAWTGCQMDADPWAAVISAAQGASVAHMLEQAIALHLPVAAVGETALRAPSPLARVVRPRRAPLTAIDMSALWAGPLCAGLLADAGIDVTRIESVGRPDPTARTSPQLDYRINSKKRRVTMAVDDPVLVDLIAGADVLITSGRPHALERIGLSPIRLFAANPDLVWVAITAHGWQEPESMRVGFGDDCAAAGGLLAWHNGAPLFIGDALADPLTGLLAATAALEALSSDAAGLIDMSLAQSAARFASQVIGP